MSESELDSGADKAKMASTIFSRTLHVQWIQGSQEVAETSFFKINSQGTALDKTEELILRNRKKSYAIASRSIVRSGTGHKYWSDFSDEKQQQIEDHSDNVNKLLFQPDIKEPIKTLDLPLGGTSSPVDALKMLIDIFSLVDGYSDPAKAIKELGEDKFGDKTIEDLRKAKKVVNRITGNSPSSLGLHPAIYFYTDRGIHSRFLFLGTFKAFSDATRNNNKAWFKNFTKNRSRMEKSLIEKKSLINQGLANVNSRQRIDRVANLINFLSQEIENIPTITNENIADALGLKGEFGSLTDALESIDFSDETKSLVFLKNALESAVRCPVCNGYLDPQKSASYDHIKPKRDLGDGSAENCQITHPFCNTAIKR